MLNLPTHLTLEYIFQLNRPITSKSLKTKLKHPIEQQQANETKQMLGMIVSDSQQYYSNQFVRIFLLIKINSLLSEQCNINEEFINELINVYNSKRIINVRLSKFDDEFFAQVILETQIYKYVHLQNVQNILAGQCLLASSLALMIRNTQSFLKKAEITFSLSFLALSGRQPAFIQSVHKQKNHKGQSQFAKTIYDYIRIQEPSKHRRISLQFRLVQDPYSMRCSPQVLGVIYECLQHLKQNFDFILNKFHFRTLLIDGQVMPNIDLFSQSNVLKGDFLVCSLNQAGAMAFLRSQRILNIYLGKNQVCKQSPKQVFQLKQMLQKTIHILADNKLICVPSNGDTMNIDNYQKDIFYTGCKVYQKFNVMMKNLYKVILLEIFAALLGLKNVYNIGNGQIFLNQTIRNAFFDLEENCNVKDKKQVLFYLMNQWMKSQN